MQTVIMCTTLWGIPKICESLYEKPASENDRFYQIRCRFSELLHNGYESLGDKERFFVKEIIGDNGWISAFAFSIILQKNFMTVDHVMEGTLAIVSGSALMWCVRNGVAHVLYPIQPSIATFVAPRYVFRYQAIVE